MTVSTTVTRAIASSFAHKDSAVLYSSRPSTDCQYGTAVALFNTVRNSISNSILATCIDNLPNTPFPAGYLYQTRYHYLRDLPDDDEENSVSDSEHSSGVFDPNTAIESQIPADGLPYDSRDTLPKIPTRPDREQSGTFLPSSSAEHAKPDPATPVSRPTKLDVPVLQALILAGVWQSAAKRLATQYPEPLVRAWIEQAELWGVDVRNRGGWIRTALDSGWRLPCAILDPADVPRRVAEAVWRASSEADRRDILYRARAANGAACRSLAGLASMCPQWRPGIEATVSVEFLQSQF